MLSAIEQVSLFFLSKANMYAASCTFTKLGLVDPLYVGDSFGAKKTECGEGWSFTKVGLVWSDFGVKRASEGIVFDPGSMMNCLRPKGSRKGFVLENFLHISNHRLSKVIQGAICTFVDTVLLWCICIGEFTFNTISANYELKAVDVYSPPPSFHR